MGSKLIVGGVFPDWDRLIQITPWNEPATPEPTSLGLMTLTLDGERTYHYVHYDAETHAISFHRGTTGDWNIDERIG